jgi:hypothetical protein
MQKTVFLVGITIGQIGLLKFEKKVNFKTLRKISLSLLKIIMIIRVGIFIAAVSGIAKTLPYLRRKQINANYFHDDRSQNDKISVLEN